MCLVTDINGIQLHQPGERRQSVAQLIGDFMPKIGTGLFIGDSGIGKTFTTLAMATSLATGKPFFGKWTIAGKEGGDRSTRNEIGATLFVLSEGQPSFPNRIDAAYYTLDNDERSRLTQVGFSGLPVFHMDGESWHDEGRFISDKQKIVTLSENLAELEGNVSLDLIILDTVSGVFLPPAENDAAITQRTMDKLSKLSKETGAFVLGITHPAKGKLKSEARGSIVFGATADLKISASHIGRSKTRTGICFPKVRDGEGEKQKTEYELVNVSLPNGQTSMVARAVEGTIQDHEELIQEKRSSKYACVVLEAYELAVMTEPMRRLNLEGVPVDTVPKETLQRLAIRDAVRAGTKIDTARRSINRAIEQLSAKGQLRVVHDAHSEFVLSC